MRSTGFFGLNIREDCFRTIWLGMIFLLMAYGEAKSETVSRIPIELSLQELMSIEISSVSKKEQMLSDAPAAIFVITQEDIRRSGATSIPEALRMVPGVEVARIDANKWAITARGFNGIFANKLLVLIDGRSVYSPLFSGVFWSAQDTLLEDIDRIEVIRGPGAVIWGSNAVNGVINIITKHARDTQGAFLEAGGGTEERGFGSARYGAELANNVWGRAYAKYFDRDEGMSPNGRDANDSWHSFRTGFRADWQPSHYDSFTFMGDAFKNWENDSISVPSITAPFERDEEERVKHSGGDILGRWKREFSESSEMSLQFYYDRLNFDTIIIGSNHDIFDLDFYHRFALTDRQEITWGLGYRLIHDEIGNSRIVIIDPPSRTDQILNGFIQNEVTLVKEKLHLILGTKLEHNDYTGLEVQPKTAILWTPSPNHTIWGSVSRAVRTPSRVEDDGTINALAVPPAPPTNLPILLSVSGSDDMLSETLIAYELGYRVQPIESLWLDIALFYNDYDRLGAISQTAPVIDNAPFPHIVVDSVGDNQMDGETYGVELAADWSPLRWWRLKAAYSFLQMQLHRDRKSLDPTLEDIEGKSPHHKFVLHSFMNLPKGFQFDLGLRYVDALPALDVKSYFSLDARLAWRISENLELAIACLDLLDKSHSEFGSDTLLHYLPTETERSIYGKVTWRF